MQQQQQQQQQHLIRLTLCYPADPRRRDCSWGIQPGTLTSQASVRRALSGLVQ